MFEILIIALNVLSFNYYFQLSDNQGEVRKTSVNPNENERETRKTFSVSGVVVKRSKGITWSS